MVRQRIIGRIPIMFSNYLIPSCHYHAGCMSIVANSYLILYPKPDLEVVIKSYPDTTIKLFEILNKITGKVMLDEGRVYGGSMHKLEPK